VQMGTSDSVHSRLDPSSVASGLFRFIVHFAEAWVAMLLGTAAFAYARHRVTILGGRTFLDPTALGMVVPWATVIALGRFGFLCGPWTPRSGAAYS